MEHETIVPTTELLEAQTAPRLTIEPMLEPKDGSAWAFDGDGYVKIVEPWAVEQHIGPIRATEKLGDVESWARYVTRFGRPEATHLTWTSDRLRAVLDYHIAAGAPGRGAWVAEHPFQRTRQWQAWEALASGRPRSQRELIEALEDRREDIRDPDAASLVEMLRKLRGTVNASATAQLDPNGGTNLEYTRQTQTSLTLPPTITIGIPVLRGHVVPDENGIPGPVLYELEVRIRVDVLDEGKIAFRLSIPNAEQALEDAVSDRVRAAQAILDDDDRQYELLRAAS